MSDDPITRLAKQRIIKLSAELEVQLGAVSGSGPTLEILKRLKERAAESLAAMAFLNIFEREDRIKFLTLQNEVKRYDEWLAWIAEVVAEGKQYDQELTAEDREEMLDYLAQLPEGEKQAIELGLIDPEPRDS